jgi:hypothetical protein
MKRGFGVFWGRHKKNGKTRVATLHCIVDSQPELSCNPTDGKSIPRSQHVGDKRQYVLRNLQSSLSMMLPMVDLVLAVSV